MRTELTERQKFILTLVIHEYVRTAQPVGSKSLVKRYQLDLSPATVRNEMAALTEMGLLRTQDGRIPTEEGYRFFVGRLMQESDLPDTQRRTIRHQFHQMRTEVEEWVKLAASVAAHQSRAASLVTAPHPQQALLKHLELISTRGRQVLMIIVLMGGEVRQKLVALDEAAPQDALSSAADRISRQFQGRDAAALRSANLNELDPLERQVCAWAAEDLAQTDDIATGDIILDGLSNVLAEPEFSASEDARRALRLLEEKTVLQDLLTRTSAGGETVGGVQVLIGGEGSLDELRPWSFVLARYGTPGLATGTLGVLGPVRMSYGRTISVVRFLSGIMSDLVSETLAD